ncbi:MAG: PKD domain-containing protein [Bacteroidetes bacterium]|nr:PKD domain-containing protein [Bacteroidota bacterium]
MKVTLQLKDLPLLMKIKTLLFTGILFFSFNTYSQPVCDAQFGSYFFSNPDSLHFVPSGGNLAGTHYTWSFGDGTFSTDQSPWHLYAQDGVYYVCLTVYDSIASGSCTDTWCDSAYAIPPPPVCDAQFSYYSISNPDSIHFIATGNNLPGATYHWDFGDGVTSAASNPWHLYPQNGTYYACLTVQTTTAGGSCSTTWCDSVHAVPQPPVCDAQFGYYTLSNPDSVHFISSANNQSGTQYSWDFGDGNTSTAANPWHLYAQDGIYFVCLSVQNTTAGGSCSNTWCDSVHAIPPPPVCNAEFAYYPTTAADSVHFYPPANDAGASYSWNFGDGGSSTAQYPWHHYTQNGMYFVCLTVQNSNLSGSCSSSWCDSVRAIPEPPVCDANFASYVSVNPDSVHFFAPANQTGATFTWSFGDGNFSSGTNPWHYYAQDGTYFVCLTVSNSTAGGSCSSTWCDSIHALPPPPDCDATFSYYASNNPDSVHFFSLGNNLSGTQYSWNFGDGAHSQSTNPWHLYAQDGVYYVCLSVYDSTSGGTCSSTWCDSARAIPAPPTCEADFSYNTSTSNPDSVHFFSIGTNLSGAQFSWSFGDGAHSSSSNPWHEYAQDGTYYACLTVFNSNSGGTCSVTFCDSVHAVHPAPVCDAQFSYYALNNPDSIHFITTGNNISGAVYHWDFGDGGTSSIQNPWHLYPQDGIYYACLTVQLTTAGGFCTTTWCDSVHAVPQAPVCDAEFGYYALSNPDSVHFISSTNNQSGTQYSWDFGDGNTSTAASPWHLYAQDGIYFVCLTVQNTTAGGSCSNTWCDSVHAVPQPPVCDAEFAYYPTANADSVHFYPPVNTAGATYSWNFGDGGTSTAQYPWHQYAQNGMYFVCLTVQNSNSSGSCSSTWCDSVRAIPEPPVCDANFAYYVSINPDSVHFFAPANPTGATYTWSFGDGNNSGGSNPWHYYAQDGTYFVCLTVSNSNAGGSCSSSWCDSVHAVPPPPECDATFSYYPGVNPDSVHFFSVGNNLSGTQYSWNFGDGAFSQSINPWHLYSQDGVYYVCLSVYDSTSGGTCSTTWCDSVRAIPGPPACEAEFSYYNSTSNADSVHFFTVGTNLYGAQFSWNFGDGNYSTSTNPWHAYAQDGVYYACLTVYDSTSGGTCTATFCDSVRAIHAAPECDAQFSSYYLNNPDSVHFIAPSNPVGSTYFWDFGDGSFDGTSNPWHQYDNPGVYLVCLTVYDSTAYGTCTQTWCDSVHAVPPPPQCDAQFSYYPGSNVDSIHFIPATNPVGSSYTWNFGDGNFSSAINPWHLYAQDGVYYVCLTVYDSTSGGTCSSTWCDSVRAMPLPPSCDAQFAYYLGNNPDSVHFISPANPTGSIYTWDFGDGNISNSSNPWHLYANDGMYYVCLTVYDSTSGGTCSSTWCDSVRAMPLPPECDAQFAYYLGTNPDSVHFMPATNPVGSSYTWSFGDGTFSTNVNPWHLYPQDGVYYVCLTVYDSTSGGTCTSTWCDSVHAVPTPPSCDAQFAYYSMSNPDSVHFFPTGNNNAGAQYTWDFGDGTFSNTFQPWHLYAQDGVYYVCLTVHDSSSAGTCTSIWCDSVSAIPFPPSCDAEFISYSVSNPDSVHFFSIGNNLAGSNYYWNFGDGTYSTSINPWHYYTQHGTYYVCLSVTDSTSGGTCSALWCDSVRAVPVPPECDAQFGYYSAVTIDSVHFIAPSNPAGTTYTWDFGDGTFSTDTSPWHLYAQNDVYYVCLTVYDSTAGGTCSSSHCDSVYVIPVPPECDAQFAYYSLTNPDSVHFVSQGNSATATFLWDFGDGFTSTVNSPWHVYANYGVYYACLTIHDSTAGGTCTSNWCDSVHAVPVPPDCDAEFSYYTTTDADSVHFFSIGNNLSGSQFTWDFGDGNTSTDINPWHVYANTGVYFVCLNVYNSTAGGFCSANWCDSVYAVPVPPSCEPEFGYYVSLNPDSVHFYHSGNNSPSAHYSWDFGDGTYSTDINPWHLYPVDGVYYACLTVSDTTVGGICSATWCDSVRAQPIPPSCDPEFVYYSISNPDSIQFFPIGSNFSSAHYSWTFGDGGTSTLMNPWHLYAQNGMYYVCLTISDSNSVGVCSNTWCDSVRAMPAPPSCVAEFVYATSINADSVQFFPTGGNVSGTNYSWDFGDGNHSTDITPWNVYPQNGIYYVCLTVSNSTAGGTCSETFCDSVRAIPAVPPCEAEFAYYSLTNIDSVHFSALGNNLPGAHYSWDFGDGSFSSDMNTWHYYTIHGVFQVCLTVTDTTAGGTCSATFCDSVHVVPIPPSCIAEFSYFTLGNPDSLRFYPTGDNLSGTEYFWNFGDGDTSTEISPWHYYNQSGMYYVCLEVYDTTSSGTCYASWCDSVYVVPVIPTCNAEFSFSVASGNTDSLHFIAPVNSPGSHFSWTFGDGGNSTEANPWHFYQLNGIYTVCLTVYDSTVDGACSATWCDTIPVAFVSDDCDARYIHYSISNPNNVYFFPSSHNNPGTRYTWTFGDGTSISELSPRHYYRYGGIYPVCLTVYDSTSTSVCTKTWCDNIDVPPSTPGILLIYPNPVRVSGTISFQNVTGPFSMRIFERTGRLVYKKDDIPDPSAEIPLNGIREGVYYVEVLDADQNKMIGRLIMLQ